MSDQTPYNVNALIYTNIILSFFSLFGSLMVIILFTFRKNLRSFVFTLIFYLSISELLNSIANIMSINKLSDPENDLICTIQATIINYTDFCSLIWMCIISYTIYILMTRYNPNLKAKKCLFIILGFILPLVFNTIQAIIFFNGKSKSKQEGDIVPDLWCWIYDMETNKSIVIILYSFIWLLIVCNCIFILRAIAFLKSNCDYEDPCSRKIRKMINKLYMYPFLSAVCFLFATIHRAYQIFFIKNNEIEKTPGFYRLEVILYLFHGIFISIRGFIFFIIYGCNSKVKKEVKKWLNIN
jgi:hypothetical protein